MDWVECAYMPFLWRGAFMDMVRGRETARHYNEEHVSGHVALECLLRLAASLPQRESGTILSFVKGQIRSDTYYDFFRHASLRGVALGRALMADESISAEEAEHSFCAVYAGMDRVLARRKDYAVGISMCSRRIGRYESIHDENVRGWYTADGMLTLYNGDLTQHSDGFHPTVNAMRRPGTTVDILPRREEGVGCGKEPEVPADWAGGTVPGSCGAAGMELAAEMGDLRARKSWFLFEREVVCLGAGITATTGRSIETIVENRKVTGPVCVTVDGARWHGLQEKRSGVRWVHFGTGAPEQDIGWFFPVGGILELKLSDRAGCWLDVDRKTGTAQSIRRRFLELVLHHGVSPENAQYQYVLLPGFGEQALEAYADRPGVEILANRACVQAARQRTSGLMAVNCWAAGERVGALTCLTPCSVLAQMQPGELILAAADPTQQNRQGIILEWDAPALEAVCLPPQARVLSLSPRLQVRLDTADAHGRTFIMRFRMA